MESTQSYTMPVAPQRAWEALTDASILRASIAGCEQMQADGEDAFAFAVNLSVEGAKVRFSGHLRTTDADPPRACTLRFISEAGSDAGAMGSVRLHFDAAADAATTLSSESDTRADGAAGAIGRIAHEFAERFAAAVASDSAGTGGDAPQPPEPSLQHAAVAESAPAGKGAKCWKAWTAKS